MFDFYTGLTSLAHNRIRTVLGRAFFYLIELNSLELDRNEIIHVDPDAFMDLKDEYYLFASKLFLEFTFSLHQILNGFLRAFNFL